MRKRLENYFRASFPCVAIQTTEESRALADVLEAAKTANKAFLTWSAAEGLKAVSPRNQDFPDTADLLVVAQQRPKNTVVVLRDVTGWPFERDPVLSRTFRDFIASGPLSGSCVVIIQGSFRPYPAIAPFCVVTDYQLPEQADLLKIARTLADENNVALNGDGADIVRALSGLSTSEAENALSLALIETGRMDPAVIYREKIQQVKKSGLLEITDPDPAGLDSIGGLDALKTWTLKRRRAYTTEAKAFGLPAPKGTLLIGPPGTGKSLSAKAIGTALGIPTLRLDVGALFNSLVGESESRTREALKLAEAISPCVLWVDEIEKGFAGSAGSGANDSGVTKRVFGTVISWMQERRRPVFLVATANDVTQLPPELLRKGRFDEIFFIDLPTSWERMEIFRIHLIKRKRGALADLVGPMLQAVEVTEGFTGSEIEAVIEDGLFNAFDAGRDLEIADLLQSAANTEPLSRTAKEKIDGIRAWAKGRARFASAPVSSEPQIGRRISK